METNIFYQVMCWYTLLIKDLELQLKKCQNNWHFISALRYDWPYYQFDYLDFLNLLYFYKQQGTLIISMFPKNAVSLKTHLL